MPPGVDQALLVAGRVVVPQLQHGDVLAAFGYLFQARDDTLVFLFNAYHAAGSAHRFHQQLKAVKNFFREIFQDLLVFLKEGFAFGGVHQGEFRLALRFHVGRKTRAAGADYAGAAQVPAEFYRGVGH